MLGRYGCLDGAESGAPEGSLSSFRRKVAPGIWRIVVAVTAVQGLNAPEANAPRGKRRYVHCAAPARGRAARSAVTRCQGRRGPTDLSGGRSVGARNVARALAVMAAWRLRNCPIRCFQFHLETPPSCRVTEGRATCVDKLHAKSSVAGFFRSNREMATNLIFEP